MLLAIIGCLLYASAMFSVYVTLSPPRPPPTKDELVDGTTSMKFVTAIRPLICFGFCVPYGFEILQRNAGNVPLQLKPVLNILCTPETRAILSPSVPLQTALGLVLMNLMGAGRVACYAALGRMFTFQISLIRDHQLITTGPYRIVRHPSSYGYLAVYIILSAFVGISFIMRTAEEDLILRREFGEQWERWAKLVPYRLIPFIY
ncbi:hypothetical protein DL96DRAFT_1536181 [Flagelloscypha sp. PMI_526]|nr:hypothetical protein DL96DRAFT_1536181 [Flagelloscypha sp. PMI_526]